MPHFPMGTPPWPRHVSTDWHAPDMDVVMGVGEPGISEVTVQVGPDGALTANCGN